MRIKKCIKCFQQYETDIGGNICRPCQSEATKKWYYKRKAEGKLRYQTVKRDRVLPLQQDRLSGLRLIKAQMKACETREERRIFYGMMFEKIFNDKPLWEYITRFGDNHIPKTNQNKKQNKEEI